MRNHWLRTLIPAIALAALPVLPAVSHAGVAIGVSVNIAPPVLPVYVQPPLPAPGYIWTPGYWAWDDDVGDYYWVPGTWVLPPSVGLLWTPGFWGWSEGVYLWHAGYWGPHIGFYGGVNYGFGYGGVGYEGGYWRGGAFFYNRAVCNTGSVHVTNVYNRTVINNYNVTRVSYNGGRGGIEARPTPHELSAEHEHHVAFTPTQSQHQRMAAGNTELRASVNHGAPPIAATARPAQFSGRGVVSARASGAHGGPVHDVAHNAAPAGQGGSPVRTDRPPGAHAAGPTAAHNEMHAGSSSPTRTDRPPGAHAAGPTAAHNEMRAGSSSPTRTDRPPGAHAAGPTAAHNEIRAGSSSPVRTDRPPSAHAAGPVAAHNDVRAAGGGHAGNFGGGAPPPHTASAPHPAGGYPGGNPGGGRPGGGFGGGAPAPHTASAPHPGGGNPGGAGGGGRPPQPQNQGGNQHRPEGHR